MSKKTVEKYYIFKAIMDDGSEKYVKVNPENFNMWGERFEHTNKCNFCLTDDFDKAEPFTYIPEDGKEWKQNIKERGLIRSLQAVEVTEEIVVTKTVKTIDKDFIWIKVPKEKKD